MRLVALLAASLLTAGCYQPSCAHESVCDASQVCRQGRCQARPIGGLGK